MTLRTCAVSFARGFALRVSILVVLLAFGGSVATASPITEINVPGAFSLATAQWVNSGGASGFGNTANGSPFYGNSSGVFNLGWNASDWFALTPVGQWSDGTNTYTLGSGLLADFQEYGVVWTNGVITSTHLGFLFQGADQFGNFAASQNLTGGGAAWGTINDFLASGAFNSRPQGAGEGASSALAVFGNNYAGAFTAPGNILRALCNGATMGTNASANAIDSLTGNCLGQENGYAAVFNPVSNSITRLPDVSGTGFQRGRITSGMGGLYTIEDGGQTFYSNGVTTWTSAQYTLLQGLSADPVWARFVVDVISGRGGRVGQGSFDLALAENYNSFNPTFGDQGGNSDVPEPSTYVLIGTGLAALACARKRTRSREVLQS